jgi:hypothetical protein
MNKGKQPMALQVRKKMTKQVKSAIVQAELQPKSNAIKPKQLLSRLPAKIRKQDESILASFEKGMEIQKKKLHSNPSKRTTPGHVDSQSAPKSTKVEGQRWIKVGTKQNKQSSERLYRRMGKKK